MKKLFGVVFSFLFVLQLAGCGGTSAAEQKPPLTEAEISQMYTDPDAFKGRKVTLAGKLLGDPQKDDSGIYFQMYGDPAKYERNTIVKYSNKEASFSGQDYVKITGTIDGAYDGKNIMGGKITAPKIVADSVEKVSYIDAVSPTLKSVDVNSTQNQYGYEVTLQKVEFSSKETRVYVSAKNNGKSNFSAYSYNTKILQGDKQYEEQSNYDAGYQKLQTNLIPGATSEGIITFPALEQKSFTIYLSGFSYNFSEKINPYTFEIAVS